jgi:hypothetical protein
VTGTLGLRRRALRRTGRRLPRERRLVPAELQPARERPRHARAWKSRQRAVEPLAEHEHVEPARTGAQRVRAAFRPVHDHVPRGHLVGLGFLPQQALACEHEEDLLIGAVLVRGRGEAPLGDLDAAQADRARAQRATEVTPDTLDVADGELAGPTLAEVDARHRSATVSIGTAQPRACAFGQTLRPQPVNCSTRPR